MHVLIVLTNQRRRFRFLGVIIHVRNSQRVIQRSPNAGHELSYEQYELRGVISSLDFALRGGRIPAMTEGPVTLPFEDAESGVRVVERPVLHREGEGIVPGAVEPVGQRA